MRIIRLLIMVSFTMVMGCGKDFSVTTEEKIGFEIIDKEMSKVEGIRSLLISINNDLVYEKYLKDYDQDSVDHVRSVTKSIMGIMVGIAIENGIFPNENVSIGDYLREIEGYDERHNEITLHHLLTMSSGMEWEESGTDEYNDWVLSNDHIVYALSREIIFPPGTTFEYNSAGSYLLSVILTEASGMSTRQFAEKYLFGPMNINYGWQRLSNYYNGAAGMQFKPRDMVKLGQLIVNKGNYQGNNLVSEEWINKTIFHHIKTNSIPETYGYQCWIHSSIEEYHWMAIGYAGQYIVAIPALNSVVTITSERNGLDESEALEQSKQVFQLIWNHIYPYLKE